MGVFKRYSTSLVIVLIATTTFAEEPNSVGLEQMARILRGDVRLIAMGDSYSSPFFARAPLSSLRVWPIEKISAISGGATYPSHTTVCTSQCNPVSQIQADDSLGYTIERNSESTYFSLPILGLQEIFTSSDFDDEGTDLLFKFQLSNTGRSLLSSGVHGPFTNYGDDLRFRFLYRCPTYLSQQVEQIKVLDNMEDAGIMQLRSGARPLWHLGENPNSGSRSAIQKQINAYATDFPANNDTGGPLSMRLEQIEPLVGTNQYFEPAGCVYYHVDNNGNREQGLYYSSIADGSWSYSGFGCDTEGEFPLDKKYSLEQLTHWLDVTTLDREQPTVFMWFFAPETIGYDSAISKMENMIDQSDTAASLVGLSSVKHIIVIGSLFNLTEDIDLSKEYIQSQQQAAYDLATLRINVSAISLFAATDEVFLHGNDAIPWLLYHGFDNFQFGTNSINLIEDTNGYLFDAWGVHPASANSAAFFSSLLGEIIREAGCQADIVADGIINTADLLAVISHIGDEYVNEDVNGDGIVSVQDVLLVIDGWGDCWPVQAPYNTDTFRSKQSKCIPLARDLSDKIDSRLPRIIDR